MTDNRISEGSGTPDEDECRRDNDVGKLYHDRSGDIWYECMLDKRNRVFTWAILPPVDE